MRSFGVPEILLLVAVQDFAGRRDEVGAVEECVAVFFDDGARDDADFELFG
jgi:hypothetical protein